MTCPHGIDRDAGRCFACEGATWRDDGQGFRVPVPDPINVGGTWTTLNPEAFRRAVTVAETPIILGAAPEQEAATPEPAREDARLRGQERDAMRARVKHLSDALEEIASGRGCQSGYGGCDGACKEIANKALKETPMTTNETLSPWVQCEEHEGTHRLTDKCVGAVYDAPPGSPEWAEGYRQGFAAGMAYASEMAYEIPEPAVASEPIPIATATPPIIDTATGLAIPVCTCVRGPSSVVPSQSCPVHGWTPEPRHA